MFDTTLRPLKDHIFNPLARSIPLYITPLHLTAGAFLCGLLACASACFGHVAFSILFWALNRALDCFDGAVARHRDQTSDLGGFLDLLGDFIVYSLVPIGSALGNGSAEDAAAADMLAVALLEASFHVNNFVLIYAGAVLEKTKAEGKGAQVKELTSIALRPALVEGAESGMLFTLMLAFPGYIRVLSYVMLAGVSFGTAQRVSWLVSAIAKSEKTRE